MIEDILVNSNRAFVTRLSKMSKIQVFITFKVMTLRLQNFS